MRRWNPIPLIAVLMMLTVMFAPVVSDESDAAGSDIVLYTDRTSMDLMSNSSNTIQAFITNDSTTPCKIRMNSNHDNEDYKVSFDNAEFVLDPGSTQTVNITLTTTKYAESKTDTLTIGADCYPLENTVVACNQITLEISTQSAYNNEDSFNKIMGLVDNPLPEPMDSPLITALITLLIWLALGTVGSIITVFIVYNILFRRDRSNVGNAKDTLNQMRKFIFGIIVLFGCANSMNVYGIDVEIVGTFTELSSFLFVIFSGIIVWKIVRVEIEAMGRKLGDDGKFDPSIIPLFLIIAEVLVVVATTAVALAIYGVDLVAIVTGLGLLTTGLSLGAKNIINQFLSGIILLTERPFVKDDKVKVDADTTTTLVVKKVGYMTTRFSNWVNEEMIVLPNNTIMSGTMTNITRDNCLYKVYDYFSISYASDIAKAKEIMLEEALAHQDVIVDQMFSSPDIQFDEINRNCINLRLSFVVNDHENYGTIAAEIRYRIFTRFCNEGIDIPYDQYSINLVRTKRIEGENANLA